MGALPPIPPHDGAYSPRSEGPPDRGAASAARSAAPRGARAAPAPARDHRRPAARHTAMRGMRGVPTVPPLPVFPDREGSGGRQQGPGEAPRSLVAALYLAPRYPADGSKRGTGRSVGAFSGDRPHAARSTALPEGAPAFVVAARPPGPVAGWRPADGSERGTGCSVAAPHLASLRPGTRPMVVSGAPAFVVAYHLAPRWPCTRQAGMSGVPAAPSPPVHPDRRRPGSRPTGASGAPAGPSSPPPVTARTPRTPQHYRKRHRPSSSPLVPAPLSPLAPQRPTPDGKETPPPIRHTAKGSRGGPRMPSSTFGSRLLSPVNAEPGHQVRGCVRGFAEVFGRFLRAVVPRPLFGRVVPGLVASAPGNGYADVRHRSPPLFSTSAGIWPPMRLSGC